MKQLAIVLILALSFGACKKGENDPFLSLKTRKGRLSGNWKVTFADYSHNDSTWTYDGSNLIKKVNGNEIYKIKVSHEYEFTRGGEYTINKTINYPENHFKPNTPPIKALYFETGKWNFTGGSGDTKTKSQLLMQAERIERRIEGLSEVDAEVYNNPLYGKVLDLDMLKNKEMRWKYDYTANTPKSTIIETGTWEFEKQ